MLERRFPTTIGRRSVLPHSRALREAQDVRCLYNHSSNNLLGRTSAGTLQLSSEADGLHFTVQLPETRLGKDIHTLVKRGDLSGCSFAFDCKGDSWADVMVNGQKARLRTLTDLNLYDVGPVTYPAYEQTSVQARGKRKQPVSVGTYNAASCGERERLKLMCRLALHL
jgi:uncharacterized protein